MQSSLFTINPFLNLRQGVDCFNMTTFRQIIRWWFGTFIVTNYRRITHHCSWESDVMLQNNKEHYRDNSWLKGIIREWLLYTRMKINVIKPHRSNYWYSYFKNLTMRNLFVLFLLIIGSNLYGQTDSIEKATLYNKMMSKEIMQEKYAEIGKLWNQSMNKYPDLPLDQSGQVHYTFVNNFKNINKENSFAGYLNTFQ